MSYYCIVNTMCPQHGPQCNHTACIVYIYAPAPYINPTVRLQLVVEYKIFSWKPTVFLNIAINVAFVFFVFLNQLTLVSLSLCLQHFNFNLIIFIEQNGLYYNYMHYINVMLFYHWLLRDQKSMTAKNVIFNINHYCFLEQVLVK